MFIGRVAFPFPVLFKLRVRFKVPLVFPILTVGVLTNERKSCGPTADTCLGINIKENIDIVTIANTKNEIPAFFKFTPLFCIYYVKVLCE